MLEEDEEPRFLAEVFAKRDFGLALWEIVRSCHYSLDLNERGGKGNGARNSVTYFPTCLFLNALNLAVQGLMIVSEGET